MTLDELKSDLRKILEEEEAEQIDWRSVEVQCEEVLRRLNTEPEPAYPYEIVYHFLDDTDVRQKSPEYAVVQKDRVRRWLEGDRA